jgi:hypothetical protein
VAHPRRAHQGQADARGRGEGVGERKSLIGSGDRSDRIRTYNFPQGRVTDHRINLTLHKIDAIMDGDLPRSPARSPPSTRPSCSRACRTRADADAQGRARGGDGVDRPRRRAGDLSRTCWA